MQMLKVFSDGIVGLCFRVLNDTSYTLSQQSKSREINVPSKICRYRKHAAVAYQVK